MDSEIKAIDRAIAALSANSELKERFVQDINVLKERRRLSQANMYRLAVMGVTSSGKSTMLNAMLGKDLLPSVAVPSSSQLVSCVKGPEWKATIYFEDGRMPAVYDGVRLTPKLISKYGDENCNPGNREKVRQIEIASPSLLLPASIIIEDSPGLDAYGLEGHELITMNQLLPSTDFCLFVTTFKTNSDQKMEEVLNEIARYDKPVIIAQNMLDSLRPSPDGKLSLGEVARVHAQRVRRIIDKSKIRDKNSAHIVQISAKYALEARTSFMPGKPRWRESKKWRASNFDKLHEAIESVFNAVKPQIERKRLLALRRELEGIKDSIIADASNAMPLARDYDSIYRGIADAKRRLPCEMRSQLDGLASWHAMYARANGCGKADVENAIKIDKDAAQEIARCLMEFNRIIENACQELNISARDLSIRVPQPKAQTLSAAYSEEAYEVKKSGFWNGFKRFFGFGGYETRTRTVEDRKENRRRILTFLTASSQDLRARIAAWEKSAGESAAKIKRLVDDKNAQQNAAIQAARAQSISNQLLKETKASLAEIIMALPKSDLQAAAGAQNTHMASAPMHKIEVSRETLAGIRLAQSVIDGMHLAIWSRLIGARGCCIAAWDHDCARRFMHKSFGIGYSSSRDAGEFASKFGGRVKLLKPGATPDMLSDDALIIMVNATQPGAAQKQIMPLLQNLPKGKDVIFVLQDLQETINGGDLKGAMSYLRSALGHIGLIVPFHANPLYALAMLEGHSRNVSLHSDEIRMLRDIRSKFGFLFERNSDQIIADLLRKD